MTLAVPDPATIMNLSLGGAALAWAATGWTVFPIVPRGKTPYEKGEFCARTDDHTCGFHCASSNREQLAAWWDEHPDSNIGLSAPDAFVVDEDRIGALVAADIHLPKCPWALTGRTGGGRHFFLRIAEDLTGSETKVTYKVAGIEVKGFDKGYVVAAPSIHATGNRYELRAGGWIPEVPVAVVRQLVDVTTSVPLTTSLLTVGGYTMPEAVGDPGRYDAIVSYTAHLYNRGLSLDEMWPLVRMNLAPRFSPRLNDKEIRERFGRATKDIEKRLGERRAVVAAPTTLTDAPLTEFDSAPIEWVWPSWLPRGVVTLMDGNPGVSKSTLVADLVARITTGREWPDGTPSGAPVRVMWITTEDDPGRVLRPRIEAAGGDSSLVRFVTSEVVFPTSSSAFQELLVKRATEPLGLALVILDPLFSHIDAKVRSIADAEMRQHVMNPLGAAAEAAHVAILVVRHFNKDTAASAINRGAGSLGGIVGAARALWSVTLDPEDDSGDTKAVGVAKLNYAKAPPPLRYRVVDRLPPGWVTGSVSGIEWLGESPVSISTMMSEDRTVSDAVPALAEILKDGPVAVGAVYNLMRSRGFGRDATRSARGRLAATAARSGFGGDVQWALPIVTAHSDATPDAAVTNVTMEPDHSDGHSDGHSDATRHNGGTPESLARVRVSAGRAPYGVSNVTMEPPDPILTVVTPSPAPPARAHTRARAECPVCRQQVEVDTVGHLAPHYPTPDAEWGSDPCLGSAGPA